MKTIICVLFFMPVLAFGQNVDFGGKEGDRIGRSDISGLEATSIEEWNYMTKGYKFQLKNGLDPAKNGYELVTIDEYQTTTGAKSKFIGMYKKGMLKGILAHIGSEIVAIPVGSYSNDISKKYWYQYNRLTTMEERIFIISLQRFYIKERAIKK